MIIMKVRPQHDGTLSMGVIWGIEWWFSYYVAISLNNLTFADWIKSWVPEIFAKTHFASIYFAQVGFCKNARHSWSMCRFLTWCCSSGDLYTASPPICINNALKFYQGRGKDDTISPLTFNLEIKTSECRKVFSLYLAYENLYLPFTQTMQKSPLII